jgi:predicted molibdopterin-dependent oxidoreductase YjgC
VLGSARATNEDNYVLARFARSVLGTPNLDCSSRTGEPLTSGEIADLDQCDLVLLVGNDPNEEHPAVSARLYRARQRGAGLIALSARRHALARLADAHLSVRPGAEGHVLAALLGLLLTSAGADGEIAALRQRVAEVAPESLTAFGVAPDDLRRVAELYLKAARVSILYSPSLTASAGAVTAVSALADLSTLGRAQAGPQVSLLALLSRNNSQGSLDMGVSPDLLPGYASPEDDAATRRLAEVWGDGFCREQGLSAWQMLGQVRALYVMGDDPIRSAADKPAVEQALSELDFLVVQDLFLSPIAQRAHVVLPAAAFGEREGTFTNLERRVQRVRPAVPPPGEAREDWRILADVSAALGRPLPYQSSEEIFRELTSVVPIYEGLSYRALEALGGVRWPAQDAVEATAALFAWQGAPQPVSLNGAGPSVSEQFPLLLVADATLGPWEEETTIARTLTVSVEFTLVNKDYPGGMLCLHPEEAKRLGLRSGRNAVVKSARGECTMKVLVTEDTPQGIALAPHWQAAALGVMDTVLCADTDRPVLEPTPVSVTPA